MGRPAGHSYLLADLEPQDRNAGLPTRLVSKLRVIEPGRETGVPVHGKLLQNWMHLGTMNQGEGSEQVAAAPNAFGAAVEPGFPARRKELHANRSALESFRDTTLSTILSGRQGCRPLRQAGMPAATHSGSWGGGGGFRWRRSPDRRYEEWARWLGQIADMDHRPKLCRPCRAWMICAGGNLGRRWALPQAVMFCPFGALILSQQFQDTMQFGVGVVKVR